MRYTKLALENPQLVKRCLYDISDSRHPSDALGIPSLATVTRMLIPENHVALHMTSCPFEIMFQCGSSHRQDSPQFLFLQSFGTFSLNFSTVSNLAAAFS
jgi:hypothetical protein